MRTKRILFLGCVMAFLGCAASAAAETAPAYDIKTPSAHNPCYDQPDLWPEGVKETAYYKQKWEPARVLVWAKGNVLGKGPAKVLYPAENWLENGKPAQQDADENCDLVFPDQKGVTWNTWLRINPTVSCRHLTVGHGVYLENLGNLSGNLWSKGRVHSWGGGFVGKQNTFVRVGPKSWILKMYQVNKDASASVEIVDELRICDWIEVNSGQLIVGPGAVLEGGNRHQNVVAAKGALALMSGATFKTFEFKRQAYDLDVFGKVLAGTPDRPLTADAFFSLSGKAKNRGTPQGFYTPMQHRVHRRDFLKVAAAAAASPYFIPGSALGADDRPAPSARIVMGGIGIGNQGKGDQTAFLRRDDVQYVAVCDVHEGRRNAARDRANDQYKNQDCKTYGDFRELLARTDIDAIHCATPDHWHALVVIDACRQGKDVYCQKPETKTLREGPMMVAAARRYNRVVSSGSQRVLQDYRKVVDQCWSGEIGPIKEINVNVGPLPQLCYLKGEPVPAGFDWDMWLGPAPWAPYHPFRCSGAYAINGKSWRSFADYSGGGMTDWGAHHFGGAVFAVDCREQEPEEVLYRNEDGKEFLTFRYPNGILLHHNHPGMGGKLHVVGTPGVKKEPKVVPTYKGSGGIYGDFIECVKTRQKPFRDIELAAHTIAVAHLGLIAYELKRSLKWDAAKCEFPGDAEANRLVDRARREPWSL